MPDPTNTTLAPYEFTVGISGDHVVITGSNGGNIRGKGGKWVTFTRAAGTPRFKVECAYFDHNDDGTNPEAAWPFDEPWPGGYVEAFRGKLKKLGKGVPLIFYKYTIVSEDLTKRPIDPVIIIEY